MKGLALMAAIAACSAVAPGLCAAQDARIAGRVTDETGAVLPGVTVEVSGTVLAAGPRVAVTDGDGRYAFTASICAAWARRGRWFSSTAGGTCRFPRA